MYRWMALSLLTVSCWTLGAQERVSAPTLPNSSSVQERENLMKIANLLSKGDFESAVSLVRGVAVPDTIRIYASWTTIPADLRASFREATIEAIENWKRALGNQPKMEWTDDEVNADIQIVFEEDVAEITAGQFRLMHGKARLILPTEGNGKRRVRARIATYIPYTELAQNPKAIAHLAGQAVGTYLGLAESNKEDEIMGPVWNSEDLPTAPTANEVAQVRELLQARNTLIDLANRRVQVYLPKPKIVIAETEYDFGNTTQGDVVKHTFRVRNEGDAPLEIDARPSCGCVTPKVDRVIPPKSEGVIEAELRTAGFRGPQVKTIQVTSNDPDSPSLTLRLTTNIRTAIEVQPSETIQLALVPGQPAEQEVVIVANTEETLEVQQVSTSVPFAQAKAERIDAKRARILITVSPDAPMGRANFLVTARTNSASTPQVNINVACEKGIIATPTTVFFGAINSSTPLPVERVVTLSRRDKGFKVTEFEVDDPNVEVRHEATDDGRQHRLILRYKGGWTQGTVRKTLRVKTDDPSQGELTINLTANVLPGV